MSAECRFCGCIDVVRARLLRKLSSNHESFTVLIVKTLNPLTSPITPLFEIAVAGMRVLDGKMNVNDIMAYVLPRLILG